jgi:hypothetical protein
MDSQTLLLILGITIGVNITVGYIYRNSAIPDRLFLALMVVVNGGGMYPLAIFIGIPSTHPIILVMIVSGVLLGLQGGRVVVDITNRERNSKVDNEDDITEP